MPLMIIHLSATSRLMFGNASHEKEPASETSKGTFSRLFSMRKKPIAAGTIMRPLTITKRISKF